MESLLTVDNSYSFDKGCNFHSEKTHEGIESDSSIVDNIIVRRKHEYQLKMNPFMSSSLKSEFLQKRIKTYRSKVREDKSKRNRGDLEFCTMQKEYERELQELKHQAEKYALSLNNLDDILEDEEDEELLRLLDEKDRCEKFIEDERKQVESLLERFEIS